jgi:hypothetical protein
MINPAAVTLLVGIFTFCEVVFFIFCLAFSLLARRRVQIVYFCKGACKGIGKFQLQRTNSEIFTTHPFFYGDKLCMHAATPVIYQS